MIFDQRMHLLTVLQHLHDVLLDHGKDDLSSEATGNPVQSTLTRHSITEYEKITFIKTYK